MLTAESYWIAMGIYLTAGVIALVLAHRSWFSPLPVMVRRVLTGLLAGILLAPAAPTPDADTLAPALVVGLFNTLFGEGWPSAAHAFAILAVSAGGAILIAVASVFVFNVKPANNES